MEGIDLQYGKSVVSCGVIEDEKNEHNGRVRVNFADGTYALGDVLVGCDGAKSVVGGNIVGVEAAQLTVVPLSMFNFTQKFPAEFGKDLRGRNPLFITSIHPDHGTMFWLSSEATLISFPLFCFATRFAYHFRSKLANLSVVQDVPDPSAPETWTYQVLMSWINDPLPHPENDYEARMKFFKKRAEEWAEPWRTAGRLVKEDTLIPMDAGTYWEKAKK